MTRRRKSFRLRSEEAAAKRADRVERREECQHRDRQVRDRLAPIVNEAVDGLGWLRVQQKRGDKCVSPPSFGETMQKALLRGVELEEYLQRVENTLHLAANTLQKVEYVDLGNIGRFSEYYVEGRLGLLCEIDLCPFREGQKRAALSLMYADSSVLENHRAGHKREQNSGA
jgi:hypothetical protein